LKELDAIPDLRRFQQFIAVAEELHFGRAAQRLGMTQPPLSMQIKRLEEQTGATLFQRSKRRVELTDAGRLLLREARAAIAQAQRAVSLTRRVGRGESGELRVAFISTADYSILPAVLGQFRRKYPNVKLVIREMTTDMQRQEFARQDLDAGFLIPPLEEDELECELLLSEPLIVALPSHHSLAVSDGPLAVAELSGLDFVSFPRESAPLLHDALISLCRSAGFAPRIEQIAVQMQTIVSLVSSGLGVAIVPDCMRRLRRDGVTYRQLKPSTPAFHTAIAWNRHRITPILERFIEVAKEAARTPPGPT
jgi:DNA-binding transcriptional LysR family regulator